MNKLMKFRDFAAAYGTCYLVTIVVSAVTWPNEPNFRVLGATLFPLIAFAYAVTRDHEPAVEPVDGQLKETRS